MSARTVRVVTPEAGGQLGGRPLRAGAEEGEQLEEPLGRVRHGGKSSTVAS